MTTQSPNSNDTVVKDDHTGSTKGSTTAKKNPTDIGFQLDESILQSKKPKKRSREGFANGASKIPQSTIEKDPKKKRHLSITYRMNVEEKAKLEAFIDHRHAPGFSEGMRMLIDQYVAENVSKAQLQRIRRRVYAEQGLEFTEDEEMDEDSQDE